VIWLLSERPLRVGRFDLIQNHAEIIVLLLARDSSAGDLFVMPRKRFKSRQFQSGGMLGSDPVTEFPFAELVQAVGALSWWSQPADCHAIGSGLSAKGG
jgi:hypothetical protein